MNRPHQKYGHFFTVFTPTHNRAHTLHRVHESLQKQTFRDFEWLIVDDGSTDHTQSLVEGWQRQSDFAIRFIWQENQGKHVAFNRGVQEADGELFLPIDSDDACVPDALAKFKHRWDSIPESERDQFSAVTALCMDHEGRLIGKRFPRDVTDSDSSEIFYKYKVRGDKWGFHRTEVLRQFPFPVMANLKFVPEGIVWSAIARRYRARFVNDILHVVWVDASAGSDRLTMSDIVPENAAGLSLWYRSVLNNDLKWFWHAPREFLRSAIHYGRFSLHAGHGAFRQIAALKPMFGKLLWIVTLPAFLLVYLRDQYRNRARSSRHSVP